MKYAPFRYVLSPKWKNPPAPNLRDNLEEVLTLAESKPVCLTICLSASYIALKPILDRARVTAPVIG